MKTTVQYKELIATGNVIHEDGETFADDVFIVSHEGSSVNLYEYLRDDVLSDIESLIVTKAMFAS